MTHGVSYAVDLDSVICCACGMLFAFPAQIMKERLRDHKPFYCPSGHEQCFTGQSTEEQLKRQLKQAAQAADVLRAELTHEQDQRHTAERSLRATKAAHTRTKNRIANGMCPECQMYFPNLDAHMHERHVGYVQDEGTA